MKLETKVIAHTTHTLVSEDYKSGASVKLSKDVTLKYPSIKFGDHVVTFKGKRFSRGEDTIYKSGSVEMIGVGCKRFSIEDINDFILEINGKVNEKMAFVKKSYPSTAYEEVLAAETDEWYFTTTGRSYLKKNYDYKLTTTASKLKLKNDFYYYDGYNTIGKKDIVLKKLNLIKEIYATIEMLLKSEEPKKLSK